VITHYDGDHIYNAVTASKDPTKRTETLQNALDLTKYATGTTGKVQNVLYNGVYKVMKTIELYDKKPYNTEMYYNALNKPPYNCDCNDRTKCTTPATDPFPPPITPAALCKRDLNDDTELGVLRTCPTSSGSKTIEISEKFAADSTGHHDENVMALGGTAQLVTIWPTKQFFLCDAMPFLAHMSGGKRTLKQDEVNGVSMSHIVRPVCESKDPLTGEVRKYVGSQPLWGILTGDITARDAGNGVVPLKNALEEHSTFDFDELVLFFQVPHHGSKATNDIVKSKDILNQQSIIRKVKANFYIFVGGHEDNGAPSEYTLRSIVESRRSNDKMSWSSKLSKCYFDETVDHVEKKFYFIITKGQLFRHVGARKYLNMMGYYLMASSSNSPFQDSGTCKQCYTPACRSYGIIFLDETKSDVSINLELSVDKDGAASAHVRSSKGHLDGLIGIDCNSSKCQRIGTKADALVILSKLVDDLDSFDAEDFKSHYKQAREVKDKDALVSPRPISGHGPTDPGSSSPSRTKNMNRAYKPGR